MSSKDKKINSKITDNNPKSNTSTARSKVIDEMNRKISRRNRISFVLTLFVMYYTLLSYHLTTDQLIYTTNFTVFKYFLYASVISIVLTLCAYNRLISKYFMFNSIFALRFFIFTTKYLISIAEQQSNIKITPEGFN